MKIPRERGIFKAKFLVAIYENKLECLGGRGGCKTKNLQWGEYGYFLELHNGLSTYRSRKVFMKWMTAGLQKQHWNSVRTQLRNHRSSYLSLILLGPGILHSALPTAHCF